MKEKISEFFKYLSATEKTVLILALPIQLGLLPVSIAVMLFMDFDSTEYSNFVKMLLVFQGLIITILIWTAFL